MPYSDRLEASTLNAQLEVEVESVYQKSVIMAGLMQNKRITFNHGGKKTEWDPIVRRKRPKTATLYAPNIQFDPLPREIHVELPWRTLNLGDKISKFDRLANKNVSKDRRRFDLVERVTKRLASDFTEDMPERLYDDGTSNTIHGFQTFDNNGGLISGSFVGSATGSYAGYSMVPGAIGGSWSTGTFPNGQGDPEYHAWMPRQIDINYSGWGGSWSDGWQQALNRGRAYMGRLNRATPQLAVINTEMLLEAEDSLADNERFIMEPNNKLTELGHRVLRYKDIEIADEYACPEDFGVLLSWDMLELRSMQATLVGYEEDVILENSESLYAADFYGNLICYTPAKVGLLIAISEEGT